jgi:hypothetical protein
MPTGNVKTKNTVRSASACSAAQWDVANGRDAITLAAHHNRQVEIDVVPPMTSGRVPAGRQFLQHRRFERAAIELYCHHGCRSTHVIIQSAWRCRAEDLTGKHLDVGWTRCVVESHAFE